MRSDKNTSWVTLGITFILLSCGSAHAQTGPDSINYAGGPRKNYIRVMKVMYGFQIIREVGLARLQDSSETCRIGMWRGYYANEKLAWEEPYETSQKIIDSIYTADRLVMHGRMYRDNPELLSSWSVLQNTYLINETKKALPTLLSGCEGGREHRIGICKYYFEDGSPKSIQHWHYRTLLYREDWFPIGEDEFEHVRGTYKNNRPWSGTFLVGGSDQIRGMADGRNYQKVQVATYKRGKRIKIKTILEPEHPTYFRGPHTNPQD